MSCLRIGALFAFLYSCYAVSFTLFPENDCANLTASQLCQISSGKDKMLKPNHSSKNLLKNACHIKSEAIFDGSSKGTICECQYFIPQEWNVHLSPPIATLTIYTRTLYTSTPTSSEIECPQLSFKAYTTLAIGHTFEDKQNRLWKSQKRVPTLIKLPKNKTFQSTPRGSPLFIKSIHKKIWVVCRYIFNNFPITIQKEKSLAYPDL
jgi:hypothetical protein